MCKQKVDVEGSTASTESTGDPPLSKFDLFIKQSPSIPGHSMEFVHPKEIPWFDHNLLQNGMDFVRNNYFSVLLSNFIGGFLMITGKNIGGESLFRRGSITTPSASFLRILKTTDRFMHWYSSDVSQDGSEGFRAVKTVRRLHQLYGEPKEKGVIPDAEFASHFTPETTQRVQIMRAELENIVDKTVAPYALLTHELPYSFSQFTVALNQLSLITTLLLFPDLVGLNDSEDLRGYCHFLAVLGRMLGLEDRFNIALSNDIDLMKGIFCNVIVASWQKIEETNVQLNEIFVQGVNANILLPSFMKIQVELFLLMLLKGMGAGRKVFHDKLNFFNKLYWAMLISTCWLIRKSLILKIVVNNFTRLFVWILTNAYLRDKSKYQPKCRNGCPFG